MCKCLETSAKFSWPGIPHSDQPVPPTMLQRNLGSVDFGSSYVHAHLKPATTPTSSDLFRTVQAMLERHHLRIAIAILLKRWLFGMNSCLL